MRPEGPPIDPGTKGDDCCDEIHPDDGRTDSSSEDYDFGGDWGNHSSADHIAENTDYYDE